MENRRRDDALLVQQTENNMILKQLRDQVKDVAEKQVTAALVATQLAEHHTIERVDKMWGMLTQLRVLLVIPALVGLIGGIVGIIYMARSLWGWF